MVEEQVTYEALTKPARWLRVLGTALSLGILAVTGASFWGGETNLAAYVVVGLCCALVLALSAWFALTPARIQFDQDKLIASYWPFSKTIPWSSVQEVLAGDRVDGFGHGYGYRWEGKGRIAFRLGGPMITVIHDAGRLGVSVPDPQVALAAAKSALRATK